MTLEQIYAALEKQYQASNQPYVDHLFDAMRNVEDAIAERNITEPTGRSDFDQHNIMNKAQLGVR